MLGMISESASEQDKKLVCWDFDGTITTFSCHTHNLLMKAGYEQKSSEVVLQYYQDNILKVEHIRELDQLAQRFIEIHEKGHHQAITSFNWFPEVIPLTIKFILETYLKKQNDNKKTLKAEQVELVANILDSLLVVGGFPSGEGVPKLGGGQQGHADAKQQHIRIAAKHFNVLNPEHICLIDDRENNCIVARANNHRAIYAAYFYFDTDVYLKQITSFLFQAVKEEQGISLSAVEDDKAYLANSSEVEEEVLSLQLLSDSFRQSLLIQFEQLSLREDKKGLSSSTDRQQIDDSDDFGRLSRSRLVQSWG